MADTTAVTSGVDGEGGGGGPTPRFAARTSLMLYGLLLTGLSLVALVDQPSSYVGDNRFEVYWAPTSRLIRELFLWDPSRGLGRVREDFWPGVVLPAAVFHSLGASPALAEHLWHLSLLALGGIGMMFAVRVFRPQVGFEHFIAGIVFMFNPYTATFLLPSALFFYYAIAPWFLVAFVKGVRRERPGRWAAVFAVLVFLAGDTDIPGLFYALVPLIPVTLYLVYVERAVTFRRIAGWVLPAGALSLAVSVPATVKLFAGAGALTQRLTETEAPGLVNIASSWAESWRGLGFWLSYYRGPTGVARPQGAAFLRSLPVIAATFALPLAALITAWRTTWRPRILFLGIAVLALVLMVGSFPVGHSSLFGRLLLAGYDHVPGLSSIRNSYKAGAGLMIGMSALVGVGLVAARPAVSRLSYPPVRAGFYLGAVAVFMLSSLPFWTGRLYAKNTLMRAVPGYWQQALSFLNGEPDTGRVFILPGSTRSAYRWGWTGDDMFDALLRRQHVVDTAIPLSKPLAANLVEVLTQAVADKEYQPGVVGPIARRLGVTEIVIRNDLDWVRTDSPRPSDFFGLRRDPDLTLVAKFGAPGTNVVAVNDTSLFSTQERSLPPVEVYAVRDPLLPIRARAQSPPLVVAGDGAAWPLLAAQGLLANDTPVEYAGELTPRQIAQAISQGSPVIITDTARRRLRLVLGTKAVESYTLGPDENLSRPTPSLFPRSSSQSVVTFAAANSISASSVGTPVLGPAPWLRPSNAFDDNLVTAWEGSGLQNAVGSWIIVRFRTPTILSGIAIHAAPPVGRRPRRATLIFSDGSSVPAGFLNGAANLTFPSRTTSSLEVRIDQIEGSGNGPVGFSEISIAGVDLSEVVQMPDDLIAATRFDPRLQGLVFPLAYEMQRVVGGGPQDEELVLHRRFDTVGTRAYDVSGTLRLGLGTPDAVIDGLRGGATGGVGSSRFLGTLNGAGYLASDGSLLTGWEGNPAVGESLVTRFPGQLVSRVVVDMPTRRGFSGITSVRVIVGNQTQTISVPPKPACSPSLPFDSTACITEVTASVSPTATDHVTIQVLGVDLRAGGGFADLPISILEVKVNGLPNPPPITAGAPSAMCVPGLLSVDGVSVDVRMGGSLGDLLTGRPVPFEGCGPLVLPTGSHRLDSLATAVVDTVNLRSDWPPRNASASALPGVHVLDRGRVHVRVRMTNNAPAYLSLGQSFDRGWRATAGGRSLGPPIEVDNVSTWVVPAGTHVIDVTYRPQRLFRFALAIAGGALLVCLLLIAWPSTWPRWSLSRHRRRSGWRRGG